ncbi:hypothetical protein ACJJI3_03230 [Microbulbifer sp. ZKSA004]|uniref:hypothetical protein n=1 Tax=Microbulbifer sp. ZKSA004 TaxID=3243389 RepID=UPI00403A3E6F
MTSQYLKAIVIAVLLSFLAACSGGGSGSDDSATETPAVEDPPAEDPPAEDPPAEDPPAEDPPAEDPPAEDPPAEDPPAEDPPATSNAVRDFALDFEPIKVFRFTWTDAANASHYHLLENPDGLSGFTRVAEDIPQGSETLALEVPLYARTNAQYLIQACSGQGDQERCTDSEPLSVSDSLDSAVGYFKASNTNGYDFFGGSVSLSADANTLAVGAPGEGSGASGVDGDQDNNEFPLSGAVYMFARQDARWVQQAYLKASNPPVSGSFGNSVSLSADGSSLAVGTRPQGASSSWDGPAAVYIFIRQDNSWAQQAYLEGDSDTNNSFGLSVSLSADGNTLAVGAPYEIASANEDQEDQEDSEAETAGAVYLFTRRDDSWERQAYLSAANADTSKHFGWSVSLSADGNTLAVGTRYEGGAVYLFARQSDAWIQETYLKANSIDEVDERGVSVSLNADGNVLAVGMPSDASGATGVGGIQGSIGAEDSGAVYLFVRQGAGWMQQAYLKASNAEAGDFFGRSVSLSADGNTLAVGADNEHSKSRGVNREQYNNQLEGAGAVYVFTRQGASWTQQAYVKASNTDLHAFFGISVNLSADGATLAVGAYGESSNATGINGDQRNIDATSAGAVYIY